MRFGFLRQGKESRQPWIWFEIYLKSAFQTARNALIGRILYHYNRVLLIHPNTERAVLFASQ
ncbi:hypothetical protein IL59_0206185 [Brucella suis bv. 4 str. 40]|nr:hypothetical protein IL59_0206185 [Brucella suis bv. 4 str. 40]